jgi:hypothetical protein
VRFRDDSQILKLFTSETDKPEVINMNILFNSINVKYENGSYTELQEEDTDEEKDTEEEIIEEFNPYNETQDD